MSGSGSGSSYAGGSSTNCQSFSIKTQLASPKAELISKLKVGDVLEIVLTPPRGPVAVLTLDGETAGAIMSPDIAQLIQCMIEGNEYHAKVLGINGGNCQLLITHK